MKIQKTFLADPNQRQLSWIYSGINMGAAQAITNYIKEKKEAYPNRDFYIISSVPTYLNGLSYFLNKANLAEITILKATTRVLSSPDKTPDRLILFDIEEKTQTNKKWNFQSYILIDTFDVEEFSVSVYEKKAAAEI